MIYLDNNVLDSMLEEVGCKISPSACFSGLCLTQSVLLALIFPECLSLPLAVVRVLRKGVLTHWPLEKQWWLCDSPILHEPVGEGTVTISLEDMALCV